MNVAREQHCSGLGKVREHVAAARYRITCFCRARFRELVAVQCCRLIAICRSHSVAQHKFILRCRRCIQRQGRLAEPLCLSQCVRAYRHVGAIDRYVVCSARRERYAAFRVEAHHVNRLIPRCRRKRRLVFCHVERCHRRHARARVRCRARVGHYCRVFTERVAFAFCKRAQVKRVAQRARTFRQAQRGIFFLSCFQRSRRYRHDIIFIYRNVAFGGTYKGCIAGERYSSGRCPICQHRRVVARERVFVSYSGFSKVFCASCPLRTLRDIAVHVRALNQRVRVVADLADRYRRSVCQPVKVQRARRDRDSVIRIAYIEQLISRRLRRYVVKVKRYVAVYAQRIRLSVIREDFFAAAVEPVSGLRAFERVQVRIGIALCQRSERVQLVRAQRRHFAAEHKAVFLRLFVAGQAQRRARLQICRIKRIPIAYRYYGVVDVYRRVDCRFAAACQRRVESYRGRAARQAERTILFVILVARAAAKEPVYRRAFARVRVCRQIYRVVDSRQYLEGVIERQAVRRRAAARYAYDSVLLQRIFHTVVEQRAAQRHRIVAVGIC